MASVLTQRSEFRVTDDIDTPVVLNGREGVDYRILRLKIKTGQTAIYIGTPVQMDSASNDTIVVAATNSSTVIGLVADSTYNLKLNAQAAGGAPSYSQAFTAGTYVDVIVPMRGCIIKAILAASTAAVIGTRYGIGNTGQFGSSTGADYIMCLGKNTSGTGTQYIAARWL